MKTRAQGMRRLLAITGVWLAALACGGEPPTETTAGELHWDAADRARVAAAAAAADELRARLEEYYGDSELLRTSWVAARDSPTQRAGLDFLAEKMARIVVWRDSFVIGAIGSSVVAGTDNCAADRYTSQLERLLAPVWSEAGVAFEVRNAGQGGACGNNYRNQVWCLSALVGDDVDVTHYSWTYYEHDAKEVAAFHEMFYRWSLAGERSATPEIINTGDCAELSDADRNLVKSYGRFGANILCMQRGLRAGGFEGKFEWGEVGDTLHTTTREGEAPGVSPERRASLGVAFRNWHPGPLMHQTTADILAMRYLDALTLALDRIDAEPQPKARWPRPPLRVSKTTLPRPLACDPEWCDRDTTPVCSSFDHPTFGAQRARLLTPVSGFAEGASPADDSADPGWETFELREPRGIPEAERGIPGCDLPYFCRGLIARPGARAVPLRFELPPLSLGLVVACCAGSECAQELLDADAEFLIDGAKPAATPTVFVADKCVEIQARFPKGPPETRHPIEVEIRVPPLDEPLPAITHVFGL